MTKSRRFQLSQVARGLCRTGDGLPIFKGERCEAHTRENNARALARWRRIQADRSHTEAASPAGSFP